MDTREVFLIFPLRVTSAHCRRAICRCGATDVRDVVVFLVVDKILVVVAAHCRKSRKRWTSRNVERMMNERMEETLVG